MKGVRSREFYIKTYGEEEGTKRYNVCVERREQRKVHKSLKTEVDLSTIEAQDLAVENGDAVRCLECGKVATRLQHTHFKHKCTGRFASGKEYQSVYVGAQVVAPNLAKLTGGTEANYVKKYGEEEGKRRWREYQQKQADSNSFEYKQDKHGWTQEEYDEYNASRASTIENFIERYGKEEGTLKWDEYCERQRYTTSLDYFIETYGEEEGIKKYENFDIQRTQRDRPSSQKELELYNVLTTEYNLSLEKQFKIQPKCRWQYDFGNLEKRKLIEFNGGFYHMDPRFYAPYDINVFMKLTAQHIWDKDARKIQFAKDNGYDVYVVWEEDWKKTKRKETLDKLLEWWHNE